MNAEAAFSQALAAVLVVLCGDRTSAEPWGETTARSGCERPLEAVMAIPCIQTHLCVHQQLPPVPRKFFRAS